MVAIASGKNPTSPYHVKNVCLLTYSRLVLGLFQNLYWATHKKFKILFYFTIFSNYILYEVGFKRITTPWSKLITYLFHDFGRHPARSSDKCVPNVLSRRVFTGRQPRTDSKVSNHDAPLLTQKNITSLYVSTCTHTHHFPDEHRLVGCSLEFPPPFIQLHASSQDKPKLFIYSPTPFHHVLLRCSLYLIPSTSNPPLLYNVWSNKCHLYILHV